MVHLLLETWCDKTTFARNKYHITHFIFILLDRDFLVKRQQLKGLVMSMHLTTIFDKRIIYFSSAINPVIQYIVLTIKQ